MYAGLQTESGIKLKSMLVEVKYKKIFHILETDYLMYILTGN